jgi:putative nucleotidyltransferase with HDIG domain
LSLDDLWKNVSYMKLIEKKVPVDELKPGMYVSSLDRPWLDTPFLVQGFMVSGQKDIEDLSQYCEYVIVDMGLSRIFADKDELSNFNNITRNDLSSFFPSRKLRAYTDTTDISSELVSAREVMKNFGATVTDIFTRISEGDALDVGELRLSIEPMVESITRNPDACIWLTRLRNLDDYTFNHSISASVWATALGRHIGLPKSDLQTLAVGVTLFDIGKMNIPRELLLKESRLSDDEFELIKSHVEFGVQKLRESGGVNNTVIDIVAYHHERFNGAGYPNGLAGVEIPVFARIAAIADCYDAMTSLRPYAPAISPSQAIKKLYEWRDIDFQSELVEEFIQSIGIYPAGTVVELSNGEVGVVLSEYRTRRLRPKIIQLLDSDKNPLHTVKVIDLFKVTHDEHGNSLEIIDALEPDAYGLKLDSLNV